MSIGPDVHNVGVLIVGAGMAGLTAKLALDKKFGYSDATVIEQSPRRGGHASGSVLSSHFFDQGPHVLFSEDREMLEMLGAPQPEAFFQSAEIANLWRGKKLRHPAHLDFDGMGSLSVAKSVVESQVGALPRRSEFLQNYDEWARAFLGDFTVENFTQIYTKKYWRAQMVDFGTDWINKRITSLSDRELNNLMESVERGLLPKFLPDQHYLQHYTYDHRGFFGLFPNLSEPPCELGETLVSLDIHSRTAVTSRRTIKYEALISTIPLTSLVSMVGIGFDTSPLRHTSLRILNLVTSGSDRNLARDWVYNYEPGSEVARISFPQRFWSVDKTITQVQMEFYFESAKEPPPEVKPEQEVKFLIESGLMSPTVSLDDYEIQDIEFANIMPTIKRQETVDAIAGNLEPLGLFLAGRYGSWSYLWSVESARSGYLAAKKAMKSLK